MLHTVEYFTFHVHSGRTIFATSRHQFGFRVCHKVFSATPIQTNLLYTATFIPDYLTRDLADQINGAYTTYTIYYIIVYSLPQQVLALSDTPRLSSYPESNDYV